MPQCQASSEGIKKLYKFEMVQRRCLKVGPLAHFDYPTRLRIVGLSTWPDVQGVILSNSSDIINDFKH